MMSYGFRGNTIRNLLAEAKRFKTVTYMSATPIDREYWFPEMQGLQEMKIDWPNAKNVKVHKVRTQSPVKTTAMMCINRIKDGTGPNYHMFMNSVKGIADIIGKAKLTPDNCRVVCANTGKNKAKLPEGFTISSANDTVKTINFYTSTCFEGCDLLDWNSRTFIICDPNRPTTVLDISTSMLQICGRIRNSRNKGEMTLIYNTTRYEEEDSLDLYMKRIEAEIAEANEDIAWLNDGPDTRLRRQLLLELQEFDAPFIRYEDGEITIDQAMIHLDIINYKILHGLFATQVNMDAEFEKNEIEIASNIYDADARYVELMATPKMSFKDCCEKYAELKPKPGTFSFTENEQLTRLRYLCPQACEAVDKLGVDTIRVMKYQKTNILRKMASICDDAQGLKIKREIDRRLSKFQAYTVGEVRRVLGEVYQDCNFNKKPVTTDLGR